MVDPRKTRAGKRKESAATSPDTLPPPALHSVAASSLVPSTKRLKKVETKRLDVLFAEKVSEYSRIRGEMKELCRELDGKEEECQGLLEEIKDIRASEENKFGRSGEGGERAIAAPLRLFYDQLRSNVATSRAPLKYQENAGQISRLFDLLGLSLTELPDGVLFHIMKYLDFLHQQRIRRVCKRWKWAAMAAEVVETTCIDKDTFYGSHSRRLQRMLSIIRTKRNVAKWKFTSPAVRTLIFRGRCQQGYFNQTYNRDPLSHESNTPDFIAALATRFPNLKEIRMTNLKLPAWHRFPEFRSWKEGFLRNILPDVKVYIVDCFMNTLPYAVNGPRRTTFPPGISNWYVPVAQVLVSDEASVVHFRDTLEKLVWPYPEEQVQWLADNAHYIASNKQMLQWLAEVSSWNNFGHENSYPEIRVTRHLVCQEHKKFCAHLGVDFFAKLSGPYRALLAACILSCMPDQLQLRPPPHPFQFGVIVTNHRGFDYFHVAQ